MSVESRLTVAGKAAAYVKIHRELSRALYMELREAGYENDLIASLVNMWLGRD